MRSITNLAPPLLIIALTHAPPITTVATYCAFKHSSMPNPLTFVMGTAQSGSLVDCRSTVAATP